MLEYTAPNGYRLTKVSWSFWSKEHGELTLYVEEGSRIFAFANSTGLPPHVVKTGPFEIWRNGRFNEENLNLLVKRTPESAEAVIHWLKDEVIKFASTQISRQG